MASEDRILNFFPGPSALPEEVLLQAQKEMLNYNGIGYGVMEMSHRSKAFTAINETAEQNCRQLMNIPNNYEVMFLQGGCCGMFSAVPLNLLKEGGSADYVVTGTWSDKAAKEAAKFGKVNLVVPKPDKYIEVPDQSTWNLSDDADYVFYCSNETIGGVEFDFIPQTDKPIVCDMSSNIMTREFDVTKFACIIAGAQKLLGPAGVTMIIIRKDMLSADVRRKECPEVWNFQNQAKMKSVYNTPPCYSIYIMGLVFNWMVARGGVAHFEKQNAVKAQLFYETMNNSNGFYSAIVKEGSRSRVNIPFHVGGEDAVMEKKFVEEALALGMDGLAGHRSVGGCRASFYNAIQLEDVVKLCAFMDGFMKRNC